jgi:hypothetical protein
MNYQLQHHHYHQQLQPPKHKFKPCTKKGCGQLIIWDKRFRTEQGKWIPVARNAVTNQLEPNQCIGVMIKKKEHEQPPQKRIIKRRIYVCPHCRDVITYEELAGFTITYDDIERQQSPTCPKREVSSFWS